MSKVICEICGTSYPETSEQCPICGYTRELSVLLSRDDLDSGSQQQSSPATAVKGSTDSAPKAKRSAQKPAAAKSAAPQSAPAQKTQVKGGKFSKRNQAAAPAKSRKSREPEEELDEPKKKESNAVLVVLLLVVIVALLAMTAYIALTYFIPNAFPEETQPEIVATDATEADVQTDPPVIPCTSIVLTSGGSVRLEEIGQNWLMNVIVLPIDTTDALVFTSSDESVATVNSEGKITAVGPGEAVITIVCGDQSMECKVTCTASAEAEPQQEANQA